MLHKTIIAGTLVGGLACLAQQAIAQDSKPIHGGAWPIQGGFNRQPTRGAGGEFTPGQRNETDRLYDELMNSYSATHHTGIARSR